MINDFYNKPNPAETIPQAKQMEMLRTALAGVTRPAAPAKPTLWPKFLARRLW